jgi:hypothetical protein
MPFPVDPSTLAAALVAAAFFGGALGLVVAFFSGFGRG